MTNKIKFGEFRPRLAWMTASAVFALLVLGYARFSLAQDLALKTFASPDEACKALFQAVQSDDEQSLQAIVGAGKEVTSSSDDLEDKLERDGFVQKYQEMQKQRPTGPRKATLWTYENGGLVPHDVRLGLADANGTEIVEGLPEGARVVVRVRETAP